LHDLCSILGNRQVMDTLDVLFIALVLWIAVQLIDSDWGGGKRGRVPAAVSLG